MMNVKKDYEPVRLSRYGHVKRDQEYTQAEFHRAFRSWAEASNGRRYPEWDAYCDVRDGVPRGTNRDIRMGTLRSNYH